MLRSLYAGVSGMKVNQSKLDVTGNNIANVGTTAFKGSRVTFSDTLSQSLSSAMAASLNKGGVNAKQVGLGVQISSIDKIMTQGMMQSTSRALDVAIDGTGYFMVSNGPVIYGDDTLNVDHSVGKHNVDGADLSASKSTLMYTKDGAFVLDNEGNLLTTTGNRVLGYSVTGDGSTTQSIDTDGTINYVNGSKDVKANDTSLKTLKIPDKVKIDDDTELRVKSYNISTQGLITAVLEDGSVAALGQIAMASFKNQEGLTSLGRNLYGQSANSGEAVVKSGLGTTADDNSSGYGDNLQGYLEMSNIDLAEQFTDMIVTTKAFQASGKMITTGDEILSEIINLKR